MIPPTYKPKKKFMQLAIAEAKRARDRGDYAKAVHESCYINLALKRNSPETSAAD